MMPLHKLSACLIALASTLLPHPAAAEEMDKLWGDSVVKLRPEDADKGQLFADGNYAMFIHWGLYSLLGNEVNGKTYYGIGEWIMEKRMAGIPIPEYKELAKRFNPSRFDAKAIVALAKDAGMKYIVITAKHHDGFAMYHSKADPFNIVDATPYGRDPMKELSAACKEAGIGFGFYYSHNQDWTFPGGGNGPQTDENGKPATFDDYFRNKCLPQVEEITSQYGPIELVWFDTPGKMPKKYVEQLIDVVRKNQPKAFVSGRAGHGLGDYQSLGDMEVPIENIDGLWETVDTTNDSWAYAWYDTNWKTPGEILHRLISTVARGGTYMLNIGPCGDGSVPKHAADSLRRSGEWIKRHPAVIYGADASPWGHALPWGDVTVRDNKLFLSVIDPPTDGKLHLPGLKTEIRSARWLTASGSEPVSHQRDGTWTSLTLPPGTLNALVPVIEVTLAAPPEVDRTFGIDPKGATELDVHFASVTGATRNSKRWMEKFGEWKHAVEVTDWKADGAATWEVDVLRPGHYRVDLTYTGEKRLVWRVAVEGGQAIQNQQNASSVYQSFPIGWLEFTTPGRHRVSVACIDGNTATASLKSLRLTPVTDLSPASDTASSR
jgi:alpha-L-fucosidase